MGTFASLSSRSGEQELEEDENKVVCNFFLLITAKLSTRVLDIKQAGSMEEYTNLFYQLISRVDLNENNQQKIVSYLSALKHLIQNVLVSMHIIKFCSSNKIEVFTIYTTNKLFSDLNNKILIIARHKSPPTLKKD